MFRKVYESSHVGIFQDEEVRVLYKPDSQELKVIPRDCGFDDDVLRRSELTPSVTESRPATRNLMLRLLITSRCNLNCAYCQMKKLTGGERLDMSCQVIDEILRHIANEKYDYVTIHFSGGEPLIAINKINDVCREVKRLGIKNVRFAISTNGTRRISPFWRRTTSTPSSR